MFSFTKCPKCENSQFKLVTFDPVGSRYKLNFIQCTACNTPVGVTDYYDSGSLIKEQEEKIDAIASAVNDMKGRVRNAESLLVQMANRINQTGRL